MRKNVILMQSPDEITQGVIDRYNEKISGVITLDINCKHFIKVNFFDEKSGIKVYVEASGYGIKGNELIIVSEDEGQWIFYIIQ